LPLSSSALPINRQRELERASLDAARVELEQSAKAFEKLNVDSVTASYLQRQRLQAWMHKWLGLLTERLTADLAAMKERVDSISVLNTSRTSWASKGSAMAESNLLLYLTLLPPERVALIVVLEAMRTIGAGGVTDGFKASRGLMGIGKAVETEYRAETIRSVAGVDSSHWLRIIDPNTQKPSRLLIGSLWRSIGRQIQTTDPSENLEQDWRSVWTPSWSSAVHTDVGGFLMAALIDVAKVDRTGEDPMTREKMWVISARALLIHRTESQPAFAHSYEYVRGRKLGMIKVNPVVAARLGTDHLLSVVHPKHLPMLVEPRKWTSDDDGAYLIHKGGCGPLFALTLVPIMRFKECAEQQSYLHKASDCGHLEPIFHGLDVLSSTPWTINRRVFDVVLTAWNKGEAIADIPASEDKLEYPTPLDSTETDPVKRNFYLEQAKRFLSQQRNAHGERCKFNYVIEVARAFVNDTFYLPHNVDFRGRAYPIPPHLSPVGDDLCRGLLAFGEKKPLGLNGLKWLQIHLANVFGYDKMSFEERARFAQDHEADILDSADRPLEVSGDLRT